MEYQDIWTQRMIMWNCDFYSCLDVEKCNVIFELFAENEIGARREIWESGST